MVCKFPILVFLFLFIALDSFAQLCQGSLGDPIVNITFGRGSNPGAPLAAATTSYQYIQADCPEDGFYTVRNNTAACFGNTWHTINTDHTGDGSGYFMLVNASFQAGAFYVDTVRGLCGGTTYEFASWILNVLLPSACNGNTIQPVITFAIERTNGTLLQSYNSGNIPASAAAQWRQYGFFFTTPPNVTDIVLRIINNAPGGCGNDLLLDDITFRPCGPKISSTINALPLTSVSICRGQSGSFFLNNSVSGGFTNVAYQWQQLNASSNIWSDIPAANMSSYSVSVNPLTPAGTLQYRLAVAESGNLNSIQCRVYSDTFSIQINSLPATSVTNSGPACEGKNVILTATGGSMYAWSGPAGFSSGVSPLTLVNATIPNAGVYYVDVVNSAGCIKKDSTIVMINPAPSASTSFDSVTICAGENVRLSATGGSIYLWSPSTGLQNPSSSEPIATPTTSTAYRVIVGNQAGCTDTAFSIVNATQQPTADAGPDKLIFAGQSVTLTGTVSGSTNFRWTPASFIDDTQLIRPLVNPPMDIQYILEAVSSCGIDADTVNVKVFEDLYIPNAFSPNDDGLNDTWNIPAIGAYPVFEVSVFGRWGQLVYQAKNVMKPWDGKLKGSLLPMGAYVYIIRLNNELSLKGSVLLIK